MVDVAEGLPQVAKSDILTIVHLRFGGIVAKHTHGKDHLLSLCKPALLAPECRGSLSRSRWKVEDGDDSDDQGEASYRAHGASARELEAPIDHQARLTLNPARGKDQQESEAVRQEETLTGRDNASPRPLLRPSCGGSLQPRNYRRSLWMSTRPRRSSACAGGLASAPRL